MKTVFLCDRPEVVRQVYGEELIAAFGEIVTGDGARARAGEMAAVEYAFSTWGMPVFTAEEVRRLFPSLKAVFYAAGSVQAFARPFLECGVRVFSAWAANAVPVSEYTVAQILLANKGFFALSRRASDGDWAGAASVRGRWPGNYGAAVGLIGVGMIGSLVAERLKAYHLKVLAFDKFLPDERAAALGVEKVTLPGLFSRCRVVSNHLANNPQTVGMLDRACFAAMPPYATFLNTGRGAQVVEADLAAVLAERPDLTAVLDVTAPEPPLPDSALYRLPNCVLTPHIAGSNGDEVRRMAAYMQEEYTAFVAGAPTRYEVTLPMLETMA